MNNLVGMRPTRQQPLATWLLVVKLAYEISRRFVRFAEQCRQGGRDARAIGGTPPERRSRRTRFGAIHAIACREAPVHPLLDPTLDVVFKLLFTRHDDAHEALIGLLTAVLRPAQPIASVEILDPAVGLDDVDDKSIVLDVRVRFRDGTTLNETPVGVRRRSRSTRCPAPAIRGSRGRTQQAHDRLQGHLLLTQSPDSPFRNNFESGRFCGGAAARWGGGVRFWYCPTLGVVAGAKWGPLARRTTPC